MSESPSKPPVFKVITESVVRCHPDFYNSKSVKAPKCACKPDSEMAADRRACVDEMCINRAMKFECPDRCSFGAACQNRRFQKAEYAPLELFHTGPKGWGVRTRAPIARDTFIIEYVGEIIDTIKCHKRGRRYARDRSHKHHYLMGLDADLFIDATKKGNIARFINHSCEPNAATEKWVVNRTNRIGFFAIRDIACGEEIVFDYKFERFGKRAQKCFCGAATCRGYISAATSGGDLIKSEIVEDDEQQQDAEDADRHEQSDTSSAASSDGEETIPMSKTDERNFYGLFNGGHLTPDSPRSTSSKLDHAETVSESVSESLADSASDSATESPCENACIGSAPIIGSAQWSLLGNFRIPKRKVEATTGDSGDAELGLNNNDVSEPSLMTAGEGGDKKQPKRSRFETSQTVVAVPKAPALPVQLEVLANLVQASVTGAADVELADAAAINLRRPPRNRSPTNSRPDHDRPRSERPPREPRPRPGPPMPPQPLPTFHCFTNGVWTQAAGYVTPIEQPLHQLALPPPPPPVEQPPTNPTQQAAASSTTALPSVDQSLSTEPAAASSTVMPPTVMLPTAEAAASSQPPPPLLDHASLEYSRTSSSLKASFLRALDMMLDRQMLYCGEKTPKSSVVDMLNNSVDRVLIGRTSVLMTTCQETQTEPLIAEQTIQLSSTSTGVGSTFNNHVADAIVTSRSPTRTRNNSGRSSRTPSRGPSRDRGRSSSRGRCHSRSRSRDRYRPRSPERRGGPNNHDRRFKRSPDNDGHFDNRRHWNNGGYNNNRHHYQHHHHPRPQGQRYRRH